MPSIPVGRAVQFELTTADVIHSFWIPSLAGKMDMIPGRVTTLRLSAERPGMKCSTRAPSAASFSEGSVTNRVRPSAITDLYWNE